MHEGLAPRRFPIAFRAGLIAILALSLLFGIAAGAIAKPSATRVYRFYNASAGTHFYTSSAAERDNVVAQWPTLYKLEGVAYELDPAYNNTPLYRFYNVRNGAHFYTTSSEEKAAVQKNYPSIFAYEGVAYQVSTTGTPVFRFLNTRNGAHFYTTSAAERDTVVATWPALYRYEGVGFYLGVRSDSTLTFDGGDGPAVDAITALIGSPITAPADPVRAGYTFEGWYEASDFSGEPYVFSTMPASPIALHAKWVARSYTITFDSDGGTAVSALTADYGSAVSKPADPTKAGFTFAGWYTTADFSGTAYAFTTMPLDGVTLYAKWTTGLVPDARGGTLNPAQVTSGGPGSLITLLDPTPPTGAAGFDGWYRTYDPELNDWADPVDSPYALPGTGTATLYARYTYNVTFMDASETPAQLGTAALAEGDRLPFPVWSKADKKWRMTFGTTTVDIGGAEIFGAAFEWQDADGNEVSSLDSSSLTVRLVVYPQLAFEPNLAGAPAGAVINAESSWGNYKPGTSVDLDWDPTKSPAWGWQINDGFAFAGWATAPNGEPVTTLTMPRVSTTVYAIWVPTTHEVTVTFDAGLGTVNESQVTTGQSGSAIELLAPVNPAAAAGFDGWYDAKTPSWGARVGTSYTLPSNGNPTLYARYSYSVLMYDSSGKLAAGLIFAEGSTLNLPTPVWNATAGRWEVFTYGVGRPIAGDAGAIWDGWYDAASGGSKLTTMPSDNANVYGRWKVTYGVTFDGNGNTGGAVPSGQTVAANSKVTDPGTTLTKAGNTHVGWSTTKDDAKTKWDFATGTVTGATTLYALWEPLEYTMYFSSPYGALDPVTAPYGTLVDEPTAPADPNTDARYKMTFMYWYLYEQINGSWTIVPVTWPYAMPENGGTLTALYGYTLTLDYQDGSTAATTTTYQYGTKIDLPDLTGTRAGYVFDGWSDPTYGTQPLEWTMWGMNTTLTAQWTKVSTHTWNVYAYVMNSATFMWEKPLIGSITAAEGADITEEFRAIIEGSAPSMVYFPSAPWNDPMFTYWTYDPAVGNPYGGEVLWSPNPDALMMGLTDLNLFWDYPT